MPSRIDLLRFVERYLDAFASVDVEARMEMDPSGGVRIGISLDDVHLQAVRGALPPNTATLLPALVEYDLPGHVTDAIVQASNPNRKSIRDQLLGAAVLVSQAKSAVWRMHKQGEPHRTAYGLLNEALTTIANIHAPPERVAALTRDAIVRCPLDGAQVAVALSCSRCVWRGEKPRTCFAPAARLYLAALRCAGVPGALPPAE